MPNKKTTAGPAKHKKTGRKTVRRSIARDAAENVHSTAVQAREFGEAIIDVGEVIKETAEIVDALAQRARSRKH